MIPKKSKKTVKNLSKKDKNWRNKIAIIIDKMSMVRLNLLATVDLYHGKAKTLHKNLSVVLGGLIIVIFLVTFFSSLL